MTTSQRLRNEYGSTKAAVQHCISLRLSLSEAAEQLQCSKDYLRVREQLYGLTIRRKTPGERRTGNRYLPPRTIRGRALAYMAKHGVIINTEAIYRAEVYAGMRA
jgi:hypothetical protein